MNEPQRSDYDQAARCLRRATELLQHETTGKIRVIREVLWLAIRRLSPDDLFSGDTAAEITVLHDIADKVPVADARTEILKSVAVLRDGFQPAP